MSKPTFHARDPLARFPAEVRHAFARFRGGDAGALDPILNAIVRDFMPCRERASDGPLSPGAALAEDLGFDSLAIAEAVFFLEDLFQVRISNQEILQVRTVGDLHGFILQKLIATEAPGPVRRRSGFAMRRNRAEKSVSTARSASK